MAEVTGANPERNQKVGDFVGKGDKNNDGKIDEAELKKIIEDVAKAYGLDPKQLTQALGNMKGKSKEDVVKKLLEVLDGLDTNDKTDPIDIAKDQTDVNKDGNIDLKDAFQEYNDAKDAGYENVEDWNKAAKGKGYENGESWKDGLKRGYANDKKGAKAYADDKKAGKLKDVTKSDAEVNKMMKESKGKK